MKNSEKWSEIQGKWDLVRVSGEFELPGSYCVYILKNIGLVK